jgi:hypothetical protein
VNGKPDAILAKKVRVGNTLGERVDHICTWAEGVLGLDRSAGKTAVIKILPEALGKGRNMLFITGDAADTIWFAKEHPHAIRERYRWVPQLDGSQFGYLVDEAK